ncbi:MAG: toll/interleukin-1 receptor domain-containing protein [Candidatus Tectomicrobia bacterium]|nr:toll/interleukin-1 receptor domain-containing protein [Candidatus Tectomicrobia bacterium]
MPRTKVFISYSHAEKTYLDELLPVLKSVPNIERHLWYDEWKIDIGDKFDPKIQQALDESIIAILLLSPHFLRQNTSKRTSCPI